MTDEQSLRLEYVIEDQLEFAATWVIGNAFMKIWDMRCAGMRPELYIIRADLEAKFSFLRETRRHTNDAINIG